jgi:hypothetical protein
LLIDWAVMKNRGLFRTPVAPIRELFDAAGLELDGA